MGRCGEDVSKRPRIAQFDRNVVAFVDWQAVVEGSPLLFSVDAVLGRWRLLLVAPKEAVLIERFACGLLCRHGVARHSCHREECKGGGSLMSGVPLLVLCASAGVRACMGVLSPAVKSGVKVRVSQRWTAEGSGEPVKYSALAGLVGKLHKSCVPGLWTVLWPSSVVKPSQFSDALPIGGAKGQGLSVRVHLALKTRIDLMCSNPLEEEKLAQNVAQNLYALLNVEEARMSIASRHDGTLHSAKQHIELQIHRSVSNDVRPPMELARELVTLVNGGHTRCGRWKKCLCRKCTHYGVPQEPRHDVPCSCQECHCEAEACQCRRCLISRAHIVLPSAVHHPPVDAFQSKGRGVLGAHIINSMAEMQAALSGDVQQGALEYAGDLGVRVHLSQIQRTVLSDAQRGLHKQYLNCFARSIHCLRPVVDLMVVGGLGRKSDVLIQLSQDEDVQRKVLFDFFAAALPEYNHSRYEKAVQEFIEAVAETASIRKNGFEIIDARRKEQLNAHNRSLRTTRQMGLRKLGKAVNLNSKSDAPDLSKVSGKEASMRLSLSLTFEISMAASLLLPGLGQPGARSPNAPRGGVSATGEDLLPIDLAMRFLEAVLDTQGSVYTDTTPNVVKQVQREGSEFSACLQLQPANIDRKHVFSGGARSDRAKCLKCEAPLVLDLHEVLVSSCSCLIKSHNNLAAMLAFSAPWLTTEDTWGLLQQCGGRLYTAIQRSIQGRWSLAVQTLQASLRRALKRRYDKRGVPSWKTMVFSPAGETQEDPEEVERVVRESDVCETCHRTRMRGGKAGCDKCFGRCCYVGVRVQLRESVPDTHQLAAFRGCEGWLQGRVEPGLWAVRWSLPVEASGSRGDVLRSGRSLVRGASAPLPACVGKGGIHDLCYPPNPSGHKYLGKDLSRRQKLHKATKELYFGEHKTQQQSAELGVHWPDPDHAAEEKVLPHTARTGAHVIVSSAWCRATCKLPRSEQQGRYAKFVGQVGVLTRPAVGGAWYVSFPGLSGEYAFSVSGGVRALSFVPAFYSSAVTARPCPASRRPASPFATGALPLSEDEQCDKQEQFILHVSFTFSKPFGPGDAVKIVLPGFSIGASRASPEDEAVSAASARAQSAAAAAEDAWRKAEAATEGLVSDGEPTGTAAQAEAAQVAAHAAQQAAASAKSEAEAIAAAYRLAGPSAASLHALKKTPVVVEEAGLQHVRGNRFPHCLSARYRTTSASDMVAAVCPRNLAAISAREEARAFAEDERAAALWVSSGESGPGGLLSWGPTTGTSCSLFPDAHWEPRTRTLTLRCSAHVRPAHAVSLSLPSGARVTPPDLSLSASDSSTGAATISARTVTGDVGPVLVQVQPRLPSFHDCAVTVSGIAGIEELADELRSASALLNSLQSRSRGQEPGLGSESKPGAGGRKSMNAAEEASGVRYGKGSTVVLERRVKRLRKKLLGLLGGLGETSVTGADDESVGVEVLVKWSHTHVLSALHSVLIFVPGLQLEVAAEADGGTGAVAMKAGATDGGAEGLGVRPVPRWLEGVSARPARAGVLFVVALKTRLPSNVQMCVTIRAGNGARLGLDPDIAGAREAAHAGRRQRGLNGASKSDTHGPHGESMAIPSARMGLLIEGSRHGGREPTATSVGMGIHRKVQGDLEVPIFWTQTCLTGAGRVHAGSNSACAPLDSARNQRRVDAARRWTRALGPPPPELVAQWIADAQSAVDALQVGTGAAGDAREEDAMCADSEATAEREEWGMVALTPKQRRRRAEKERASVLAKGIYAWFRQLFEAQVKSPASSPAVAFNRHLLSTAPLRGLGAASVGPEDVRALMLRVAAEMGAMPLLPGPRLRFLRQAEDKECGIVGSISLPLLTPLPALRYPLQSAHVSRRVVISKNYLIASGWRELNLTRPEGFSNRFLSRPPASIPTGDLNDYYFEKMYAWAAEARSKGPKVDGNESVWEWLPKAWESKQATEAEQDERAGRPPKRRSYDKMITIFMRPSFLENLEAARTPAGDERWTCLVRLPMGARQELAPWQGGTEISGLEIYLIVGLGALHQHKQGLARAAAPTLLDSAQSSRGGAAADTAVGLKWIMFGFEAPKNGVEVRSPALAAALQRKAEFHTEEIQSFDLPHLTRDSFIRVGDKFYKPADPRLPLFMRRVTSLTRYGLPAAGQGQAAGDEVRGGKSQDGGSGTTNTDEGHQGGAEQGRGGSGSGDGGAGGDLWEAVVDVGPDANGATGGWEGWIGEALLIAQQRQGLLTRCEAVVNPSGTSVAPASEGADSLDIEAGRRSGLREQGAGPALHWFVRFEGSSKKAPDCGPYICRRGSSALEFCVPDREEALSSKRSLTTRVSAEQRRVRLGQKLCVLDLRDAELCAALDESQLRHIAQSAVNGPSPVYITSKSSSRAGDTTCADRLEGAGVADPHGITVVATPGIRRGKDVMFYSAAAGEEVVLKRGWTREGTRKASTHVGRLRREEEDEDEEEKTRVQREKEAARRARMLVLEKTVAALRADIKMARTNLRSLPPRSQYSAAELRRQIEFARAVVWYDEQGAKRVTLPAKAALDAAIEDLAQQRAPLQVHMHKSPHPNTHTHVPPSL